ncbi:MAG: glycosyltransferase family A protein [Phenylobacterium sp.]|uniref:glycosyltransferase family 2 protein n=1 Tax=Phenylobacterium sp. TaxID=1871053 RepID=UPI0027349AB9|nr:glycosyltransferase family A protein [Phenylobacterium sp.]MDP3175397.1 glycosyltransferase family A protein [Phenylobacterium sp.]
MTTVTAVIPVFNDAAYLAEALRSVLDQTLPPTQVLVVDDGSTDASAEVARGFAPQVEVIAQANQGIGGARNTGIAAASGDLIAFLDADDVWPLNSLQVRLEAMKADPSLAAAYGTSEHFFSPDLDQAKRAQLHLPQGHAHARFAGAMLIRRRMFDEIGLFDPSLRVGEMIDWASRLQDSGARIAKIDALVMRRRIHGDNTVIRERPSHGDYLKALRASVARKAAAARDAGAA